MSNKLIEALVGAGVITEGDRVRRVVIDLQVSHMPMIHIERYGDERLLDVFRGLQGVEIRQWTSGGDVL